jgi:hypothetical protein
MLRIAVVFTMLAALWASPAHADRIPPQLEMAIHLKILSFDAGLKERATGTSITIAILYSGDHRTAANDYVSAIAKLADKSKVTVHGKPVRAVALAITPDLGDRLSGVSALYVLDGVVADQVSAITQMAFARQMPTLTGNREYLSSGVAVAVVQKGEKSGIVVHAGNAKQSGMVLDSKLLRLAEVVK